MKPPITLENWPQAIGIELVTQTPARGALEAKLVTVPDLVRLKVIARLHARGLPPYTRGMELVRAPGVARGAMAINTTVSARPMAGGMKAPICFGIQLSGSPESAPCTAIRAGSQG